MNTGLPTLLGWEYHVQQRGTPQDEIRRRSDAIQAIYSTNNVEEAYQLLQRFNVELVVVSDLEHEMYSRGTYNSEGLVKWDLHPDLFKPVFRSGPNVVYRTAFSNLPLEALE